MEPTHDSSLFGMQVDANANSQLSVVSKWSKFIAVTGIITVALFLLLLLSVGSRIVDYVSELFFYGGTEMFTIMIIIIALGFLLIGTWLYFLLRASNLISKALTSGSTEVLTNAFKALKNFFTVSIIISSLSLIGNLLSIINK